MSIRGTTVISVRYRRLLRRLLPAVALGCLLVALGVRNAEAQFTRFENFTDEQGLGNASVSALAQDADGYILLGTEAGLYRFDGSSISPYDVTSGLPQAAWIRKLATDDRRRIWVVTTDGIYVRNGLNFSRVEVGRPLHFVSPHTIAFFGSNVVVDDGGTLLQAPIGARAVGSFSPLLNRVMLGADPDLAHARFVTSDADGALLIGCGAEICRWRNGRISALGAAEGLPADAWQVALRAQDGTLWARSLDRLAWRRPGQTSFAAVTVPGGRSHFNIAVPARLDLLADGRGGVFTQGEEGLLEYDGRSWRSYRHHDGGLSANPVQSLMFDREGSLWVGSIGHGAFRSLGLGTWEHWTVSDGLPSDIVWSMTRLHNGQFWVATYGDAVPLDGRTPSVSGGSENVSATRAGRLWLAPLRAPLVRVDPAHGLVEQFAFEGTVSSIYVDPDNRLWLSTDKALLTVADADASAARVQPTIALPLPTAQVMTDRSGATWAATATGIVRRDPSSGQFRLVIPAASLHGQPTGLAIAQDGDLWTFTDSAGVLRFRLTGDRVERLPSITAPLIGSNNVVFLYCDRRNWMWVGTDHGIDMFDGSSWRRFDVADGLISNDLDQWAVFEDADASMWFGTSRGLMHLVDPLHLPPVTGLHPLVTSLSIGSRLLSPSPLIRTDWSSAPLVIRFVDLDFTRGRNVLFRYRMRGLDTGWSETTGHEVRYAGLPAGRLHFELVAVDPVHGSNSALVGFTLRIRAPWWRRWWFYASCALALAGVVAGTWQTRMRLLLRHQRRLEKLVGERTAEIEQARSELQRLAMSDALTGLPNRRAIMNELEEAIATALSSGAPLAVLLCDIDHFKKINDGYGHLAGDTVLTEFGCRLKRAIERPEAAGRYGGEEFCVVLPASRKRVLERVSAIRSAIADAPYHFGRVDQAVTSSGGVAFLRNGETALSLLARADAALYRAKERGRNRIEHELLEDAAHAGGLASEALGRSQSPGNTDGGSEDCTARAGSKPPLQERHDLERDLRDALAGGQFLLNYQPVVDVRRDVVTSCEALIRWHSPTRGKVSPVDFIPFAEEVGLMPEIGDWVLRAACQEATAWPATMRVSVNLSAVQFRLPDLVDRVEAALTETGLPPERLELEVTETAMIEEMEAAICMLQQLRALGITVALDDFGTGYSSLSFLRTLPFDRIKIDRSFVQDLGQTPQATVIVRAIAGMCASLGASITAEGVETDEQIETLCAAGCSELQGYRIGRPCSAPELGEWLGAFAASHTSEVGLPAGTG